MTGDRALRALGERWWLILLCLLLGLAGAAAVTTLTPRQYSSDVTLYVAMQGQAVSADAANDANELAKERVASYAPLLADARVTQPVIDRLGLGVTPAQLAPRIDVIAESDTVVLTVAVRDTAPDRAAATANELAVEFAALIGQLEQPVGGPPPVAPGQPAPAPDRIGVQVIHAAVPNPVPVSPNPLYDLALGAALGLLVGVAAALVREIRDTSVRSAAGLAALTGFPVLAELPYDRRVPIQPLTVDEDFGSPRAEEFRRLRTALQFRPVRVPGRVAGRVVVVTSARIGEGSSTTAANLCTALAEAGHRILLLEANLRDPELTALLGLDPSPGLSSVLAGRMAWPYARRPWNRGGFDVLPAGPVGHHPSQLVASSGMADLLGQLRQQYDFVIVDAPALLPVSDAAAVAARADGVVLVVQHRRTDAEQVRAALAALAAVSAPVLGTVLTMSRDRSGSRTPGYRTAAPNPHEGLPEPDAVTSPPTGLPVPPGPDRTDDEGYADTDPATQQIDSGQVENAHWRPSPTRRP